MLRSLLCWLLLSVMPGAFAAGPAGVDALKNQADGRLAHVIQRGRLIVGVKTDYPPWGMLNREGRIVGLEADLARDLGRRLGLPVALESVTTSNRLTRLRQGQVDVVIATLGDTAVRRQAADLIRPHYYASGVRLLTPDTQVHDGWEALEALPVCLTEGAYFNRELVERFGIEPRIFPGTRDSRLALRDGRCVGWAYDDSVLSQVLGEPGWSDFRLALPTLLKTPWAIAVARGEGERSLGRFIARTVADWHRSGWLLERQRAWGIPASDFLKTQWHRFQATDAGGQAVCRSDVDGTYPETCLEPVPEQRPKPAVPAWAERVEHRLGLDLTPLFDALNRQRLLIGIATTLSLSVVAILGSLAVGVALALAERSGRGVGWHWLIRWPSRMLVSVARMTPPILQLYIVFFGLGGLLAGRFGLTLSGFMVASLVFSVYAGASNAALLSPALARQARQDPQARLSRRVARSIEQSFEGLVAIMVNIVKAAGMASTIAVPEVISAVNRLIAEGGDAASLMTLLLVFYFCFVLVVMALLNLLKRWVTS